MAHSVRRELAQVTAAPEISPGGRGRDLSIDRHDLPAQSLSMGFRFFRRVRILPGVTLNLSKRGMSTSVGVRGAHVTVGHGKVRETAGIPGSGMFYTTTQDAHETHAEAAGEARDSADASGRWTFGRVVRWLLLGILALWLIAFGVIAAIANWPG